MDLKIKKEARIRRHKRVRAKINGSAEVPRLCVFRSAKHIYAQLIDDESNKTLLSASDLEIKRENKTGKKPLKNGTKDNEKGKALGEKKAIGAKSAIAYEVGKLVARKSLEKKINKVIFDRGGYKFHGRVKSLAQGARDGGLIF